jgi:aminomuconate-semialdehyde/2-hydroxymuconate-6-semialdehyde dehydrogenase
MNVQNTLYSYVNGEFADSGRYFDNINPVDGSLICKVSEASKEQVDQAVKAARRALKSEWGSLSVQDRSMLLHRVADRMEEREAEFISAEIADTGKPLATVKTIDIPRGTANFRFFADLVRYRGEESFRTVTPTGDTALNYTVSKPLGVVAVVSPWNLPLLLSTWKIAPALACGNTVILKPSEETPSTATLLAEVMHEVGVPPGVFSVLHGFGPDSAGEFLTSHDEVDAVTFTGESGTGSKIMQAVAPTVKPISFELGGKNAAVVFADSNLDEAIAGVARSTFTNCGQVCLCTERVYVERPVYEEFVAGLCKAAESLKIGRPYDDGVSMGPLISKGHQQKVLSYFDIAREDGATFVTGGNQPSFGDDRDQGSYVEPTVLCDLADDSRFNREEVFGPVCHVSPFDGEDEVIDRVNDTVYGLAACLWTENLSRAHRVAPMIETGIVWVNTWYLRDLRTPFGGVRLSGIGREGGLHSLAFYSEPSNICIKLK